jgi:hypothetical protein
MGSKIMLDIPENRRILRANTKETTMDDIEKAFLKGLALILLIALVSIWIGGF